MQLDLSQWYKILAPRPVVLVSTVNEEGVSNAAPFSFVMPCSMKPPIIAFGSVPKRHTAKNIQKIKDFVVNIPGRDIIDKMWQCAHKFPEGVSEIKESGLTEEKSATVKSPRIKECIANYECRLFAIYPAGDHILIAGEILFTNIKDELYSDKKYLVKKADPLMHIGGPEFGLLGEIIKANEAA